ncbi:hypothetical protein EV424DRAFT_1353631 [Suillus variegatus]|nr:hypothetical protein EV424DRAFT_1353631 [Suillus variegatus]
MCINLEDELCLGVGPTEPNIAFGSHSVRQLNIERCVAHLQFMGEKVISPFLLGYHLLDMGATSAAHAANAKTSAFRIRRQGTNIMLGGIAAQLFAVVVYVALTVEILLHFQYMSDSLACRRNPEANMLVQRILLLAITTYSNHPYIREYADNALYWVDWLDSDMVTLATHTLDLFHPRVLVEKEDPMAHAVQQAIDEANSLTI